MDGSEIPDDAPVRRTFISNECHNKVTADNIAEMQGIGVKRAFATLEATNQRGIRSAISLLSRRYRTDRVHNLKCLNSKFATDTLHGKILGLKQNKHAQVFTHKCGFCACYHMLTSNRDQLGCILYNFSYDFGVPEYLSLHGAIDQVGDNTLFMKTICEYQIAYHMSGLRRLNENSAEGCIRELKKQWCRIMMKRNVPRQLWNFVIVWVCETINLSVSRSRHANLRTVLEHIPGETPDISECLDFGF